MMHWSKAITPLLLALTSFRTVHSYLPKVSEDYSDLHSAFTLIGYSSEPMTEPEGSSTSLSHCTELCKDTRELCIGFQWLPDEEEQPDELPHHSLGTCWLLRCAPKISPGKTHVYFVLTTHAAPNYGTLASDSGYRRECTYAFKAYEEGKNFTDALETCEKDGARLMFTRDMEQHTTVNTAVVRSIPHWIGLRATEGVFTWLDGTAISKYSKWGKNQPNNYRPDGVEENQDCVILHNGVWNDEQCSKSQNFLCQIVFIDV